ncbi:hypothetical protein CspeluHIS016_0302730 [Cutaneotrichosporon spelunceum]|uniref:Uncharacterized protein n=1 Tax=Cutaneotrichosporon spelunceum TaxID=1672016 RepID=A0AAD3TTQ2_9TREE|nr:hypothetical protein CspeluHIS016_0302730 [Cutaneotrichosporon spelunceum]
MAQRGPESLPRSTPNSITSLDEWFAIAREDLPRATEIDSDLETDDDFVLVTVACDFDIIVEPVQPALGTAFEEAYFPSPALSPTAIREASPRLPIWDAVTPGPGAPPASAPAAITLNVRKITAPSFNTEAALAFDERWIGSDIKIRRSTMQWFSCGCCRQRPLNQHIVYPLSDVVFRPRRGHVVKAPTERKGDNHLALPCMEVRVVDAAEELHYRLVREAARNPALRRSSLRRRS